MKAAMYRRGKIVVDSAPDPIPGSGQVLVKTLACGICGSDLHFHHHARKFVEMALRSGASAMNADLDSDIILGHEFCAEIVDYGPETTRLLKPGRAVCSIPLAIGHKGLRSIGYSNDFPGGFGEYMVLNEGFLLPLPDGLQPARAALTEPMAVGWHAVKLAGLTQEHIPLVIGCGPVGLAVIAALKRADIRPIIACDYSEARRGLAIRMGADAIVDPADGNPYAEWSQISGIEEVSEVIGTSTQSKKCVVFECVGVPGILRQIMEGVPENSDVIVVGACMEADTIEPMIALYKALTLKFSRTYTGDEFADVLRMIGEGVLHVDPLVTGTIALDEVPAAFESLARPDAHAKILIDPRL